MSHIPFATNLITFFNTAYWGMAEDIPYPEWTQAFLADPRSYFDRMLDGARDAGMDGVELAPDPGGWDSALIAYGSVEGVRRALDERGLILSSSYAPGRRLIGEVYENPERMGELEDLFDRHAAFVAELGARNITIGNLARSRFGNAGAGPDATAADYEADVPREQHEKYADVMNRLGAAVAKHDVALAIHTDAFSICSRARDIDTVMELTDPASVKLCPDAGHITLDGEDAVAILDRHIDRIPHMHWKDCAKPLLPHTLHGDQKARSRVMHAHFRILGSGIMDWDSWMRVLQRHQWSGWAIEEIDMSPDPVGELITGKDYFAQNLDALYPRPTE